MNFKEKLLCISIIVLNCFMSMNLSSSTFEDHTIILTYPTKTTTTTSTINLTTTPITDDISIDLLITETANKSHSKHNKGALEKFKPRQRKDHHSKALFQLDNLLNRVSEDVIKHNPQSSSTTIPIPINSTAELNSSSIISVSSTSDEYLREIFKNNTVNLINMLNNKRMKELNKASLTNFTNMEPTLLSIG